MCTFSWTNVGIPSVRMSMDTILNLCIPDAMNPYYHSINLYSCNVHSNIIEIVRFSRLDPSYELYDVKGCGIYTLRKQ